MRPLALHEFVYRRDSNGWVDLITTSDYRFEIKRGADGLTQAITAIPL
jgi:hypothetical protein